MKPCHRDRSVKVQADAPGEIAVDAQILIDVPPERVWTVLTDYDHLAELIPGVAVSHLVSENGEKCLEQVGELKTPFMQLRLRAVLRLQEIPCQRIDFTAIDGDFNRFDGHWELVCSNGTTHLGYHVVLSPKFYVPQFLLGRRLRKEIEHHLDVIARLACRPVR